MNREQMIHHIRKTMVEQMDLLKESVETAVGKMKAADDRPADYFDLAALESSKAVELKCRTKEWQMLLQAKETIMRIDLGLHGFCDSCGRPISRKRLRAAPASKLCLACQQDQENRAIRQQRRLAAGSRMVWQHA
ncbi:MAG TPA: TraR/DksA family transcriptional regulator [Smithellaceae bacterium]|nr:TraR/DksA family transcriptional regulator [Smithellaceae bacterium]